MNVEAIFRYVDADEDGALFVHNPNLANAGSGPSGCPGVGLRWWRPHQALSRAFEPQADAGWPPPLASPVSFRRATQTYKAVRRAIQHSQESLRALDSQESLRALAKRYGVNPKTVAKWKARSSVPTCRQDPSSPDRQSCQQR